MAREHRGADSIARASAWKVENRPMRLRGEANRPVAIDSRQVYKHIYTDLWGAVMNSVRWNVAVSADTDQAVRMFLASQGGGRKGDLSRFIEEAVRAHLLELSAEQAKMANVNVSEADLMAIVSEAVQWAREH